MGRRRYWALFALSLGSFATALDNLVLNIALPTLTRELGASTSELQWIVDSYILVFAGLLLVGGSLGDRFGRAKVLRIGLVLFASGSVGAAFASDANALTAWRALMGVGGAMIVPPSVAIVANIFTDARERGRALGIYTAVAGMGLAFGPVVGGVLLAQFWWGSVFLVNVPIVAVVLALGWWAIPESRNPEASSFDPLGVVLSVSSVSLLVFTAIQAPAHGWSSIRTVALFGATATLFTAFVVWERRSAHPMLEIDFFRNPRFSVAMLTAGICTFSFGGILFMLTLLLQLVFGYSAVGAGLRLLPLAVSFVTGALFGPRIAERVGTKLAVAWGLLTFAGGAAVLGATVSTSPAYGLVVVAMFGMGIGNGIATAPNTDAAMGAVPRTKAGIASGTLSTSRQMSSALGVAVIGSLLVSGYRSALDQGKGLGLSVAKTGAVRSSLGDALRVAHDLGGTAGSELANTARAAFVHGFRIGTLATVVLSVVGALLALRFLPARARQEYDPETHAASLEMFVD